VQVVIDDSRVSIFVSTSPARSRMCCMLNDRSRAYGAKSDEPFDELRLRQLLLLLNVNASPPPLPSVLANDDNEWPGL
jgi:hypothetical protein